MTRLVRLRHLPSLPRSAGMALLLLVLCRSVTAEPLQPENPGTQPAPATATMSAATTSAPAAVAATAPATTKPDAKAQIGTTKVHLKENPNMRIWGRFSPRQMLHMGITAIVIVNVIGWSLLIYRIRCVLKENRRKKAAASAVQSSQ